MKTLFTKYLSYTKEASAINDAVTQAIKPIVDEWLAKGYSPVEIGYIMHEAVYGYCADERIRHGLRVRKEELAQEGEGK